MDRTSVLSLVKRKVELRAMTRRHENRERAATMSSESPSVSASRSGLLPRYLKGNTATQNPSSMRVSVEASGGAEDLDLGSSSLISTPALRSPSSKGSSRPLAKCQLSTFERTCAANSRSEEHTSGLQSPC